MVFLPLTDADVASVVFRSAKVPPSGCAVAAVEFDEFFRLHNAMRDSAILCRKAEEDQARTGEEYSCAFKP